MFVEFFFCKSAYSKIKCSARMSSCNAVKSSAVQCNVLQCSLIHIQCKSHACIHAVHDSVWRGDQLILADISTQSPPVAGSPLGYTE